VNNISGALKGVTGPKQNKIASRLLCHFFRADIGMGMAITKGLGLDAEKAMLKQHAKEAALV
jgi:catalase